MVVGSLLFLAGAGIQAGAINLAMLILGRVTLGLGVGECNHNQNTVENVDYDTAPKARPASGRPLH